MTNSGTLTDQDPKYGKDTKAGRIDMADSQLARTLEVELMDTADEAAGYDSMDHSLVNARFVADFLAEHGPSRGGWVADIGTGTALIPLILAIADRRIRIKAVDGASHMLAVGSCHVAEAGLQERVVMDLQDAKKMNFADGSFESVISNSIIHHIPNPESVFREMVRILEPGGTLFVRDLARPVDGLRLSEIVEQYAADAPPIAKKMFEESLHAALTVREVAEMVSPLGIPGSCVGMTSDRHWTLVWQRPV
jgi:ubiquinone/menaquinone biosynthesis C-methylase UbiE